MSIIISYNGLEIGNNNNYLKKGKQAIITLFDL